MSAFGQFSNGPIQFNPDSGAIESRGTIDRPSPTATSAPATPIVGQTAPSPDGGGVLPDNSSGPIVETNRPPPTAPDATQTAPFMDTSQTLQKAPFFNTAGMGMVGDHWSPEAQNHMIGSYNPNIGAAFPGGGNLGGGVVGGLDDGGEVDGPEGVDQGSDSSTLDPMGMFKSVLAHGRKSMGLPTNFQTGQSDEPQQSFDDGGGVLPEDDGDGDEGGDQSGGTGGSPMPDPRQTLKYLTGDGAVSPEVAGALEQHVDPQGQMSQSQRTMAAIAKAPTPEAQFGMMQHYRTQFNGFAGGAAAAADKGDLAEAAGAATKAFAHVPTGKDIQFAPAGNGKIAVMAKALRQVIGSGPMGQAPVRAGDDAWEKFHGSGGTQSMDAGGEVDEENVNDNPTDAGGDQPEEGVLDTLKGEPEQAPAPQEAEHEQPMLLSAEQFKKVVQSGYDSPVDDGWEKFVGDALGSLGPSSAQAAPAAKPQQPYVAARGGTLENTARQMNGEAPTEPSGPGAPQAAPAAEPAKKGTDFSESDAKYQHTLERAEKLANRLFPWASQQDQRSAYVAKVMDEHGLSENRIDLAQSSGKLQMEQEKEKGRNARAASAHTSREGIARQKELWTSMRADKQNLVRSAGQIMLADPGIARDPQRMTDFLEQHAARIGIHPEDLRGMIEGGIAQSGGSSARPAGANQSAAKPGDTKPYTKNGVTKNYKFGTDGMWHLSQ